MRSDLKDAFSTRAPLLLVVLGGFFVLTFGKLTYVMLFLDRGSSQLEASRSASRRPDPPRGKILDANGNLLATSVQRKSLTANPRQIDESREWPLAKTLSDYVDRSAAAIYKDLTKDRYFVWVARKLPRETVARLEELDLQGLRLQPEYDRVYPQGRLAASVLGFVGVDNQGLGGIEKQYNDVLSNVDVSGGNQQQVSTISGKGVSVRLTINQTIQHIVEEELRKVVKRENPDDAMVLAMEPETGRIRAMVNWPNYNPNRYEKFGSGRRRNRIISDVFEPGSTLKPVTMAIGLSEGAFEPSSTFGCDGYVYLPSAKHTIHCHSEHGELTVPEILIQSCNVGVVKAAQRIQSKPYYTSFRDFGFGTWSGVRLPGEAQGSLRRPSNWSSMTQPAMAIGQGISTTALQITNAISLLVNDGVLMKPRIVRSVRSRTGKREDVEPFRIRRVVPEDIAGSMRTYMQKVVQKGTGQRAALEEYRLGGKTGTAQKPNREEGGYYQDKFLASFVGFGPSEDPELVVGVFLDNPKEHHYGGEVAAPLFRKIMKRSLRYYENRSGSETLVSR